jgi:tetratricopeptide (TPR) repeat protein
MEEPKPEPRVKRVWAYTAAWIGGITAVLGFIAAVTGAFGNLDNYLHRGSELRSQMALAQGEASQGEFAEADRTYTALLQSHPDNKPALDARLVTTESWVRNFHALEEDGKSTAAAAVSLLDQIFPILDSAFVDATGPKRADVQAHLGWAHWLNRHIAMREFGPVAEQDLRSALATDPTNVYANAMLGNWILQNHGEFSEALQHFNAAVATRKERPFVRQFQLAGLKFLDVPGARGALFRALNDMRRNGEPLPADFKTELAFCCSPGFTTDAELTEVLTAVPRDEAWQTYTWMTAESSMQS